MAKRLNSAKLPPMAAGQRYGRLTSVKFVGRGARGAARWEFICECGASFVTLANSVRTGKTRSCGCLVLAHAQKMGRSNYVHGGTETITFSSWTHMLSRCRNPNSDRYKDYGGRGIKVCERWDSFEAFLSDMGERPSKKHSIDRIDVDGHYEPANCRWATSKEQARNRRNTVSPPACGGG